MAVKLNRANALLFKTRNFINRLSKVYCKKRVLEFLAKIFGEVASAPLKTIYFRVFDSHVKDTINPLQLHVKER